jgi:hypothetical protein
MPTRSGWKIWLTTLVITMMLVISPVLLLSAPSVFAASGLPGAPQDLSADFSENVITLSWSPPSDDGGYRVDYYVVYRNGTSVGKTTDTEKVFLDMAYGVEYSFKVRAHNLNGLGEVAGPLPVKKVEVPGAPVLNATITMNDILLTWKVASDGGSDITNYSILGSSQNDPEWVELGRTDMTEFWVEGPEKDVLYHFKVSAENLIGIGPFSNEVSLKFNTPPGAPVLFLATYVEEQLMIRWNEPGDDGGNVIDHYQVYLDRAIYDYTTMDFMSIPGGPELIGTEVSVRAHNAIGYGPMSEVWTVSDWTVPSSPLDLTVVNNFSCIQLTWMQPSHFGNGSTIHYSIYRWETGTLDRTWIGDEYGTGFIDYAVRVSGSYYYQVYSVNDAGKGGSSTIGPCSVKECNVEGRVVDEIGAPIGNASVFITFDEYITFQTLTDEKGHFDARAIPGNTKIYVEKDHLSIDFWIVLDEGKNNIGNVSMPSIENESNDESNGWWLIGLIPSVLIVGVAVVIFLRKKK